MTIRTCFLFLSIGIWTCLALTAEARVDVKTISKPLEIFALPRKNIYAIGRAAAPDDFVTLVNGSIHVSRLNAKTAKTSITVTDSMKTRVDSLTFANVIHWAEAELHGEERTPVKMGPFMNKMLKELGYERPGRFPFLIKGKFTSIEIIASATTIAPRMIEKKISGIIVGFLNKTARDDSQTFDFKLEMHFVDDEKKRIGTVADFYLDEKAKASLFIAR